MLADSRSLALSAAHLAALATCCTVDIHHPIAISTACHCIACSCFRGRLTRKKEEFPCKSMGRGPSRPREHLCISGHTRELMIRAQVLHRYAAGQDLCTDAHATTRDHGHMLAHVRRHLHLECALAPFGRW